MGVSQIHFRSISLPSRLHPINVNSTGFEAEFEKLKSLQTISSSKTAPIITSEAIQSGVIALAELYNSVGQLTQDGNSINESLESSVELLDSCSTIKELMQMLRENVQSLQSALRRKGLEHSGIRGDVAAYLMSRRKMNKCISKSLKKLKNLENNKASTINHLSSLTIAVFKCILVFFSSSASKSGGWNLVQKLMLTKSGASGKDHGVITEVGCVDLCLNDVQRCVVRSDDRKMVERSLQNLESCVQEMEDGLERLFRQLLKSRVALLNIITHH